MTKLYIPLGILLSFSPIAASALTLQAIREITVQVRAFDGLTTTNLYNGKIEPGKDVHITALYQGLALISFPGGQSYPLIIGPAKSSVIIDAANNIPNFSNSPENVVFYKSLQSDEPIPATYPFITLMLEAKRLLESSSSIKTMQELKAKRAAFYQFVAANYAVLRYSDMVARLVAQSFMMHENVSYQEKGGTPQDILVKYYAAVIACAKGWLDTLAPHMPRHQVMNHLVSLYYERSMVAMAARLLNAFEKDAICPKVENCAICGTLPEDTVVLSGRLTQRIKDIDGRKDIIFVSESCPVSMTKAVVAAREADGNDLTIIVAPLEPLSEKHRAMNGLLSGKKLLFVDDEKWQHSLTCLEKQ